jgi:hypothetical protein
MKSFQPVVCFSLGCRKDVVATQDIADGLVGQLVSEIGPSSHNAVVAPTRILLGYPYNQTFYLFINPGSAVSSTRLRSIKLVGDQFPIPAQNGVWFGPSVINCC